MGGQAWEICYILGRSGRSDNCDVLQKHISGFPFLRVSINTTKSSMATNPALSKPLTLSPELEEVVGKGPIPRTEVVSKLWVYIKKHNLQNPKNKRNILADDKLKAIFGGKSEVTMFEMTKLVSAHLS